MGETVSKKCEDAVLQVLICTLGEGVQGLMPELLPPVEGVEYIVSWQRPDLASVLGRDIEEASCVEGLEVPELLSRKDFKVYVSASKGLSMNRNIAISKAASPLCLIADDDMGYTPARLRGVIEAFACRPDADILAFRYEGDDKYYPEEEFDLKFPLKGWYVSSVEIAFRRKSVIKSGVIFDCNLGLGAPRYGSGEEELWLYDALQAGLKGCFVPLLIGRHRGLSTGVRNAASPSVLRAQGYVQGCKRTSLAPLRLMLKACRVWRLTGRSVLYCYGKLIQGWVEGLRRRQSRDSAGMDKPTAAAANAQHAP